MDSDQLTASAAALLQTVLYNAYLCVQYTKLNYPEAYNVLYYVLMLYTVYRVVRFTLRWFYSTLRSVIRAAVVSYVLYVVVSLVLLLDSGEDVNVEDQVVLLTTQLLQQIQRTFRVLRVLLTTLVTLAKGYTLDIDFEHFQL